MSDKSADNPAWSCVSASVDDTLALGRAIGAGLAAEDVLALVGDLGAGKTQLVRGLAQGLGVSAAAVASPTFVLMHEYEPLDPAAGGPVLVHIDAYRLRGAEDLESLGLAAGPHGLNMTELAQGAVVVIEWADRLADLWGEDLLQIHLVHRGLGERIVTLTGRGAWRPRLRELTRRLDAVIGRSSSRCLICRQPAPADGPHFPFCSQRCKLIDLGRWLGGSYVISRPAEQRDLEEGVD